MTRITLRVLIWLAAGLAVAGYLALAMRALTDGARGDLVEAAILDHAARFAHGQSPYSDAGDGGVQLMPGFPLLVSWLMRLFDDPIWVPRLLSLLATLASAILVESIVRHETQSATLGAGAAGLALMGQGVAGGEIVVARPESLMLLLALGGALALRHQRGIPGALIGALAMGAACFTHPAALWFAIAALLHLAVFDHRRMVAYALGLVALVCGVQFALSQAFGPWFNFSAWDAGLQAMRFEPTVLLRFVGSQLLGALAVCTLATVLSFALPIRPWQGAVGIWTWMAFAALAAGIVATQGGNTPTEAMRAAAIVLAIAGPVSMLRITQHLASWPGGSRMGGQAVVLAALALQFVSLFAGL